MPTRNDNTLRKIAYFLIIVFILTYTAIIGKNILAPLAFAAVLSFLLKKPCDIIESKIHSRVASIFLAYLVVISPLIILIFFFTTQVMEIVENISFMKVIEDGTDSLLNKINSIFGISPKKSEKMIEDQTSEILPLDYIGNTISISSTVLIQVFLTFIYSFLLLLYRSSIKQFILVQFDIETKESAAKVLSKIQNIIQGYLYGLLIVVVILGVLNSIGLFFIGLEYPIFWGFLASALAVIPYVGTGLGGILPILFAAASTGELWQPFLIFCWFAGVQAIEGNFITPKIVGNSVNINPLFAILALLIGGSIWGVAGMILSLPFVAIIRVIFSQIDYLKPFALLLSSTLYGKEQVFEDKFDERRFRLFGNKNG